MIDKEKIRVEISMTCENKETYTNIRRLLNSFPCVTNVKYRIVKESVWTPKKGEIYWAPVHDTFEGCMFRNEDVVWGDDKSDYLLLQKGWVFRTAEECLFFCAKLNEAVEGIEL